MMMEFDGEGGEEERWGRAAAQAIVRPEPARKCPAPRPKTSSLLCCLKAPVG